MSEPITIDIFVEDAAHEGLLKALVERISRDEVLRVSIRVRSARGGHGRAIQEFELYQSLVESGLRGHSVPDVVVVGIDGNCTTFAKKREEIVGATRKLFVGRVVAACPDPHVERWYLADPQSFHDVVGDSPPPVGKKKCKRGHYKRLLADAVRRAGQPAPLGGLELATELVDAMNLHRAGINDRSLRAFVTEFQNVIRQLRDS